VRSARRECRGRAFFAAEFAGGEGEAQWTHDAAHEALDRETSRGGIVEEETLAHARIITGEEHGRTCRRTEEWYRRPARVERTVDAPETCRRHPTGACINESERVGRDDCQLIGGTFCIKLQDNLSDSLCRNGAGGQTIGWDMFRRETLKSWISMAAVLSMALTSGQPLQAAQATSSVSPKAESAVTKGSKGGYAPGVILVGLKPGIDLSSSEQPGKPFKTNSSALDKSLNALKIQKLKHLFADPRNSNARNHDDGSIELSRVYRLHLPASADVAGAVQLILQDPGVEYAEPDYDAESVYDPTLTGTPSPPIYPNDPRYSEQLALPAIGAPDAWRAMQADAKTITLAVIDSGICATHGDLAGRIGDGWDYVDSDAVPQDDFGHGCSVTGVIAANVNDGLGMAGVAPNASIMPLRVLNSSGVG
jgi:hypothetical protein